VLVRRGRITQGQLEEALEIQRSTLQRLGHILVKRSFISPEELVDALQIQSTQIIYNLFRWREGSYHFDPIEKLDYDQLHSTPISSETILMEGARMVDEWPIIERRIPSDKIVLRRSASAAGLGLDAGTPEHPQGPPEPGELDIGVDLDLDLSPGPETPPAAEPGPTIKLSAEERQVLALVDGQRTVREIADRLALPEFETFRILSDLLTRNLAERVETAGRPGPTGRQLGWVPRLAGQATLGLLALAVVAVLVHLPSNSFTPWQLLLRSPATEQLRLFAAMARLERIERAVQVFYLDAGTFPADLSLLVQYGYLDPSALVSPWGRPVNFALSAGGYQLVAEDGSGEDRPELTISRSFSEVQRLLTQADEGGEAGPP
jgi:hypothetical protein